MVLVIAKKTDFATISFCIHKWHIFIGHSSTSSIFCCTDCCLYLLDEKQNINIMDDNIRNTLCSNLYTMLVSIGNHYRQRLKTTHYFLSLVLIIIILFLFPSSLLTLLGSYNDNMAYFFIGICSFIVLLLTILIYLVIANQYKQCNKAYHKLLFKFIDSQLLPRWNIKYPLLLFDIKFPIDACCNSIDTKHGVIFIRDRKMKINKWQNQRNNYKEKQKQSGFKEIEYLLTPNLLPQIHAKYNV